MTEAQKLLRESLDAVTELQAEAHDSPSMPGIKVYGKLESLKAILDSLLIYHLEF